MRRPSATCDRAPGVRRRRIEAEPVPPRPRTLRTQAAVEAEQLREGTRDDAQPGARRRAGAPREVADRHLDDAEAAPADARQELGRDHGPLGLGLDAVEGRAAKELEG